MLDSQRRTGLTSQAREAAVSAAQLASISITELHELGELEQLSKLLSEVWATSDPMVTPDMMRALTHAGNYVAGASQNADMIGGIVGFLGLQSDQLIMHSHILGVAPDIQARNIGFALKQHQRAWALDRGIERIQWTFDPLVSRNAYFNISKLGARVSAYYPGFYGSMSDGINAGDETDRALVVWQLNSAAAIDASLRTSSSEADLEKLVKNRATTILADNGGRPRVSEGNGNVLVCHVPSDIVGIRESDLDLALAWRKALRSTLGRSLDSGFVVDSFSREGAYVLTLP